MNFSSILVDLSLVILINYIRIKKKVCSLTRWYVLLILLCCELLVSSNDVILFLLTLQDKSFYMVTTVKGSMILMWKMIATIAVKGLSEIKIGISYNLADTVIQFR